MISYQLVAFSPSGKLEIKSEAAQALETMGQKHSIVAVTGPYRSGKSFLLNLLMNKDVFVVGNRVQACTEGIWVHQLIKDKKSFLFIDVEGFGSTGRNANDDGKLLAIALSVSSMVIYNSLGVINESKINHLALALSYCQMINTQFKDLSASPHLVWVLRDFILELVNVEGEKITSDQYLESVLKQDSKNKTQENSVRIRETILEVFPNRKCFTLPRPVDDENVLQNLSGASLKPDFLKSLKKLQKLVFAVQPKQMNKKFIRGKEFLKIVKVVVDGLNSEKIPHVPSAWQSIVSQEYENLFDKCMDEQVRLSNHLRTQIPTDDSTILLTLQSFKERVEKVFIDCHFCDEILTRNSIFKFSDGLDEELNSLITANRAACLEHNVSLLNTLFPPLFIAIENNEFEDDIDKLENEWSNLMEQFENRSKGTEKLNAIAEFSRRNQDSQLGRSLHSVFLEMKTQVELLKNQRKIVEDEVAMSGKSDEEIMTQIIWNRYKMQEFNNQVKIVQKSVLRKL